MTAGRESLFVAGMREGEPKFCWRLLNGGDRCCILPRGHDGGVHEPPKPTPKPRKTKAQLEQELAAERVRNAALSRSNASLLREREPPDFSYFGLGDGPT